MRHHVYFLSLNYHLEEQTDDYFILSLFVMSLRVVLSVVSIRVTYAMSTAFIWRFSAVVHSTLKLISVLFCTIEDESEKIEFQVKYIVFSFDHMSIFLDSEDQK